VSKATCKHCGFSWTKGTDSGHTKDKCIERLKADLSFLKKLINRNHIKFNVNPQDELKRLIELNLTTEQGEQHG